VFAAGGGRPQGGAFAALMRSALVWRRRLRRLGGSPFAARRSLSAWRAAKAAAMRRLRATNVLAANSAIGASPASRHQPRERSLLAGSLTLA
jgi:hypothetical protein